MTLRYAIRNLSKRSFLNFIKILGLSLSLSGFLLITLYIKNELTYESFNKNAERIYRFTVNQPSSDENHFARVYNPSYIPKMADYFPQIENFVRLAPVRGGIIKHNEGSIIIKQAFECDSTFFRVFDAELLVGSPENILNEPGSLVISESFSNKIFGKVSPIGQVLTIPSGQFYPNDTDYIVKGIMKDFPQNSHLHPEFITTPVDRSILSGWAWTYLLLSENADPERITSGFKDFYAAHMDVTSTEIKIEAYLQNISEIHLYSNKLREIEANSNIYIIYTLAIASLILLITGLSNYTNLNAGMAGFSRKYLFISKISSSLPLMTLKYFLIEGILIITASLIIFGFFLALADVFIQRHLGLNLITGNAILISTVVFLFSISAILLGFFPLIKEVDSKISTQFRNVIWSGRKGLSKSLIVLQFVISTALIISVLVIRKQTSFALESGMGFKDDNLICLREVHSQAQNKFKVFKEELLKFDSIESVSAMFEPPGGEANDNFQFKMEGYVADPSNKADNFIGIFPCDYSFATIFGLEFIGGNNFSEKYKDNVGSGEYIINESAMKRLSYTDPDEIIGKDFELQTNIPGIEIPAGKITGVVKDFHLSGIKKKIEPLVMFKRDDLWLINFVIQYRNGMKAKAMSDIEITWNKMFPGYPFQYEYVNSMYRSIYRSEILQSFLLSIFTVISLFLCSMGLLGMSFLSIQNRTKEIGLRKINGATTGNLMIMLNWDLVKWILLAFVIAAPIGGLAMKLWLKNYAYKIDLQWWMFIIAGFTSFLIALLTVSLQCWKSASKNPVETLRYE